MSDKDGKPSLVSDINEILGGIFRHMLPGVIVVGGIALAYPDQLCRIDLSSWEHLLVVAVVAVTAGNILFALNRFGPHQLLDLIFYTLGFEGPARKESWNYLADLGEFVCKSLYKDDQSARARQHIAFRASAFLLILTLSEAAFFFSFYHSDQSVFERHKMWLPIIGSAALVICVSQFIVIRRIDHSIVSRNQSAP